MVNKYQNQNFFINLILLINYKKSKMDSTIMFLILMCICCICFSISIGGGVGGYYWYAQKQQITQDQEESK